MNGNKMIRKWIKEIVNCASGILSKCDISFIFGKPIKTTLENGESSMWNAASVIIDWGGGWGVGAVQSTKLCFKTKVTIKSKSHGFQLIKFALYVPTSKESVTEETVVLKIYFESLKLPPEVKVSFISECHWSTKDLSDSAYCNALNSMNNLNLRALCALV